PSCLPPLFFSLIRPPPTPPLFPYTTLFRSHDSQRRRLGAALAGAQRDQAAVVAGLEPVDRRGRVGAQPGRVDEDDGLGRGVAGRSEEHTSELQSRENLVCRLLLEKKKNNNN